MITFVGRQINEERNDYMEFADRLIKLRESKKLRQEDVAKIIDVARSTYSMYEQGKREPSYLTLCKLTNFYGVTADYLLKGTSKTDTLNKNKNIRLFDINGLDSEAVKAIEMQIEFFRWKAIQGKRK